MQSFSFPDSGAQFPLCSVNHLENCTIVNAIIRPQRAHRVTLSEGHCDPHQPLATIRPTSDGWNGQAKSVISQCRERAQSDGATVPVSTLRSPACNRDTGAPLCSYGETTTACNYNVTSICAYERNPLFAHRVLVHRICSLMHTNECELS